ncbi:MAG: zinc ribbon domain-containing protein [Anaerolineae bacterium]|nr:zinc ribbon domain-containing protein [Anaerolineae bacterium]MDW8069278.1 zinc ribbon domain-containing protein [Anaerolineae bacterium]
MPLYEYFCQRCQTRFDALRPMSSADAPILCPRCGSGETRRLISLFSAIGSEGVIAGAGVSCASCAATSCAGCGSRK